MKKFSKLLESSYFVKEDIEKVNDILIDLKDEHFDIKVTSYGANGLPYGKEIPDYVNNFTKIVIDVNFRDRSSDNNFFNIVNIFNQNIQNSISHLEEIGKVFNKTKIEYSVEHLHEYEEKYKHSYYRVLLESTITILL
jgi:hypothetical protein